LALPEKQTYSLVPTPFGMMQAVDVQFKTVKEEWNIYELEDGSQLRIRFNVAKVSRILDPKTGKTFIQPTGEPAYNINGNPTIATTTPKEVLEKLQKE
jgi:hypothetical protein